MSDGELLQSSARALVAELKAGGISPLDLLDVLERRIAAVDGKINALPTLCFDRARDHAAALMQQPLAARGQLAGLPVPIKDLTAVAGVRTTYGSPIYADFVPDHSDILVRRLEQEGALIYAKSNTPEFGAGGNTFNPVLGTTCNPYDLTRSVAGSSGGAAAALASGTAWLAHGSDMGGSLRNPASFCGIVGLRPELGRVASGPSTSPFQTLSMQGPMARSVGDVALMLDAMTGEEALAPLSSAKPATGFLTQAEQRQKPLRVAWSADLGITPVDGEVRLICEAAARKLQDIGVEVVEAQPDFHDAHEIFQTLRALDFAAGFGPLMAQHGHLIKEDITWNIKKGL